MSRLERPDALARHLEENAGAWQEILGKADPTAIGVFGRLEALARGWAELHRAVLAPFGLNYAELTTIGMLRTSPPDFRRSPTELRRLVGQTSAGMTRILGKLEAGGLVHRTPHAEDGRRLGVVLTARGAELAEESFRALHAALTSVLGRCGRQQRDEIRRGLDALLNAFSERPEAERPRRSRAVIGPARGRKGHERIESQARALGSPGRARPRPATAARP